MKKLLILVLTIGICFVMSGCSKQENTGKNSGEISNLMYESESVKVTFDGLDEEMPGVKFIVENKTDKEYVFVMQTIEINGKDETPSYSNVVQAKEKSSYTANVSTVEDFTVVNADVLIYDMQGTTIDSFKIKDKKIK